MTIPWTGEVVPTEILRYMDEKMADYEKRIDDKLDQNAATIKASLDSHTVDEAAKYKTIIEGEREIRNMVAANRESSDSKHGLVMLELKGNSEKIDKVIACLESAFIKNDEGKPDYMGHANAHIMQKKDAQANYDLKEYIKKVVLAAAFIAVGSWIAALIWQGVLHGPVK